MIPSCFELMTCHACGSEWNRYTEKYDLSNTAITYQGLVCPVCQHHAGFVVDLICDGRSK